MYCSCFRGGTYPGICFQRTNETNYPKIGNCFQNRTKQFMLKFVDNRMPSWLLSDGFSVEDDTHSKNTPIRPKKNFFFAMLIISSPLIISLKGFPFSPFPLINCSTAVPMTLAAHRVLYGVSTTSHGPKHALSE